MGFLWKEYFERTELKLACIEGILKNELISA